MARSLVPVIFQRPLVGDEFTQKTQVLRGTFTVTGTGNYVSGGIPVSWAVEPLKTTAPPFEVLVWSAAGSPPTTGASGYVYVYNAANQKVQIFENGGSPAAFQEMANGLTLPSGVLNDYIQFRATFSKYDFFAT